MAVGFVAKVRNALDGAVAHEVGDALDQRGLVDHVGQLGDDQRHALAPDLLDRDPGAHQHPAAALSIRLLDVLGPDDHRRGWEVRALDELHEVVLARVRGVQQVLDRASDFAQVVRREARRHPDRDARGAVEQQIGDNRGQDLGHLGRPVEILDEVHGVPIDLVEHRG